MFSCSSLGTCKVPSKIGEKISSRVQFRNAAVYDVLWDSDAYILVSMYTAPMVGNRVALFFFFFFFFFFF